MIYSYVQGQAAYDFFSYYKSSTVSFSVRLFIGDLHSLKFRWCKNNNKKKNKLGL